MASDATRFSYLSHLECSDCAAVYDAAEVQGLSACGSPLVARYDLDALAAERRQDAWTAGRDPVLWRYHELLPVASPDAVVSLGEGMTPILELKRLGTETGLPRLLMKDEGALPTGTFKARGAAVGVSRAAELGLRAVGMPTNGNAGAAWATYAARAGLKAIIAMPKDAPVVTRAECLMTGANLFIVDGLIGDAGAALQAGIAAVGPLPSYQDVSTFKEPYRLEGKKTMGFEIAEQLGWNVPDVILYPTGGGVGLVGMHKAFAELRSLGWLGDSSPRFVAVQAAGCAPVVRAFERGERHCTPWEDANTVAFGITVPNPIAGSLVLEAVYQSEGTCIAIADADALATQRRLAEVEGCYICPEGAAAVQAALQLREGGWIAEDERVLVLNTGNGAKYAPPLVLELPVLAKGEPVPLAGLRLC